MTNRVLRAPAALTTGFIGVMLVVGCSAGSAKAPALSTTATTTTTSGAASTAPSPTASSTGPTTSVVAAPQDFASPDEVIATLASAGTVCTGAEPVQLGPNDTYLAAASTCDVGAEKVAVATFTTPEQRKQYLTIGLAGTGAYPHFVMGTTWAVATFTLSTSQAIAGVIGGDVY